MAMLYGLPFLFWVLIFWSVIWKGIALWKSGRNNQVAWFVVMFVLNTAGILPIVYLLLFQPNRRAKRRVARKRRNN